MILSATATDDVKRTSWISSCKPTGTHASPTARTPSWPLPEARLRDRGSRVRWRDQAPTGRCVDDRLRILDVRTILVTDDDQRIYCSYRGVVYTPAAGQGQQYWRITPIFETSSEKYAWLNRIVAVGVRYSVPQRVAYRVFQSL